MLMKQSFFVATILIAFAVSSFAQDQSTAQLKDSKDKASYAIGLNIGRNFKKQNVDINPDALTVGVKDALSGKKPALNETEERDAMNNLQKEAMEKQKALADKNAAEGKKFLEDNKK